MSPEWRCPLKTRGFTKRKTKLENILFLNNEQGTEMFSSGTGSLRSIDRDDLSLFLACNGSKRKYENRARRSISSDCKHFLLFGHTNTAPRVMCVHVVFKKIMIGGNALLSK